MQQIKELLDTLGDRPLITPDNAMGKQALRLARWIIKQGKPNEAAARRAMGMVRKKPAYRKVKYHLRLYLLNSITSISTAVKVETAKRPAVHRHLWHQLANISSAPRLFANPMGRQILHDISTEAKRHNLRDQVTQAKVLSSGSGRKTRDKRMKEEDVRAIVRRNYVEAIIRRQFGYSIYMNKKRFPVEEKVAVLKGFLADLQRLNTAGDKLITLKELYLEIKIALYQSDLANTLAVHEKAMMILEEIGSASSNQAMNFHANLIRCYIKSDAQAEGLKFVEKVLQTEGIYSINRYMILELGSVLALRGKYFEAAEKYYYQAIVSPIFTNGSSDTKETIEIIKVYLTLLTLSGHLSTTTAIENFKTLRIHQFTNDLNVSQKDKKLRNLHVIIIKLLDFCLHRRNQEFTLSDAIRKYIQRHLKEKKYNRVKNFILALMQHPEHGFNVNLTYQYSEKYLERMKHKNEAEYSSHAYLEIIPYDFLWEMALETGGKPNCRDPK